MNPSDLRDMTALCLMYLVAQIAFKKEEQKYVVLLIKDEIPWIKVDIEDTKSYIETIMENLEKILLIIYEKI